MAGPICSLMAPSESVKDGYKQHTWALPKVVQMHKMLFTVMHSKGKPVTGPTIIEKAISFYDK